MSRQKKIKSIEIEAKPEVIMTDTMTLEGVLTEIDLARVELEKTKREIVEKRAEIQANAKRDISEDEMVIIEKRVGISEEKKAAKEKIEAQKHFDNVRVTGKFINRRAPGQPAKLTYQKYIDDPVKWYTFEDGKVYTIPRGFADQIRDHYNTPRFIQREGPMDPSQPQSQVHEVDTSNKKYDFTPINW